MDAIQLFNLLVKLDVYLVSQTDALIDCSEHRIYGLVGPVLRLISSLYHGHYCTVIGFSFTRECLISFFPHLPLIIIFHLLQLFLITLGRLYIMTHTGSRHFANELFASSDIVGDTLNYFAALISPFLFVCPKEGGPIDHVGQLLQGTLDFLMILLNLSHFISSKFFII